MKKYRIKSVIDQNITTYTPQMRYAVFFWMDLEKKDGKSKLSTGYAQPVNSRDEALTVIENFKQEMENRKLITETFEYIR
jgi:hypothetical protein